jgi:hypothetical protein
VTWRRADPVYVRFALNPDRKSVRIVDLRMPNPTSEALRSLPLARIETAANANAAVMLGFALLHKQQPPPDVPDYFRKLGKQRKASERAGRFLLERPEGRRLDDGFFIRVARAYREAAALGLNPRQALARDSGSAPDTVARWVAEARKRGYLPKGQAGKVTVDWKEENSER